MEALSFKSRLPNDQPSKVPMEVVDILAAELVEEYQNPDYHKWYCRIIYEFGPLQVEEWRQRAREGASPGKLFSAYVKSARLKKRSLSKITGKY